MQIKEEQFNDKEQQLKKSVAEFLNAYMQPSFGSISKRDIDIKLFCFMQDLGLISSNPSIYEVMRALNITRSKARNLIYEAEIRKELNSDQLDDMLRKKIAHPIFGKIGDKISIEIDNDTIINNVLEDTITLRYGARGIKRKVKKEILKQLDKQEVYKV